MLLLLWHCYSEWCFLQWFNILHYSFVFSRSQINYIVILGKQSFVILRSRENDPVILGKWRKYNVWMHGPVGLLYNNIINRRTDLKKIISHIQRYAEKCDNVTKETIYHFDAVQEEDSKPCLTCWKQDDSLRDKTRSMNQRKKDGYKRKQRGNRKKSKSLQCSNISAAKCLGFSCWLAVSVSWHLRVLKSSKTLYPTDYLMRTGP